MIAADTDNDSMDDIFYKLDALGRRVGRDGGTANVVYFQDGQQTIADYPSGTAASSPTYTYVYVSYIDEPVMRGGSGGLRYYHRNQQYSITAVSDGGGTVVERYAYSAYGQVTIADASGSVISNSAIANRYTYTGREWDEGLSLYHYRARMFDPISGRFVSRDPIRFEGSPWNLYEYVGGLPLIFVDPAGLGPGWPDNCCAALSSKGLNYAGDLARQLRKKINAYRGAGDRQDIGHYNRIKDACRKLQELLDLLDQCYGPTSSERQSILSVVKPILDAVGRQCRDPNLRPPRNPVPEPEPAPAPVTAPVVIPTLRPAPIPPPAARPWFQWPFPPIRLFPLPVLPVIIRPPEITGPDGRPLA